MKGYPKKETLSPLGCCKPFLFGIAGKKIIYLGDQVLYFQYINNFEYFRSRRYGIEIEDGKGIF